MIKQLVILIILLPLAFACYEPSTGGVIDRSVILCSGEFILDNGMDIFADDIVVDCNKTVLRGYENEEAFRIVHRDNITIKNCEIENFQIGIHAANSDNIKISENTIKNNILGLLITESDRLLIQNNMFENNSNYAVFLDNESRLNNFSENTFSESSFNFQSSQQAPYNNYLDNTYINTQGPEDYLTDYTIKTESEEEENEGQINETIMKESLTNQEILMKLYQAKQLDPERYIKEDLEKIESAKDKVEIIEEIIYGEKSTTYKKIYTAKENLDKLQIIEFIPKTIAQSTDEMIIYGNYLILEKDPLIMWEYEDIKAGQQVETSFTVNKIVKKEKTQEVVCLNCAKKKSKHSIIIPLLLIPLIVIIFVVFEKLKKPPSLISRK